MMFIKIIFIFVRQVIEQTKVHSKILELLVITWYETLTEMSGVHQPLVENAFPRTSTDM